MPPASAVSRILHRDDRRAPKFCDGAFALSVNGLLVPSQGNDEGAAEAARIDESAKMRIGMVSFLFGEVGDAQKGLTTIEEAGNRHIGYWPE
jgi:hypothetical protein